MNFTFKKQIGTIAIVLIFSFYTTLAAAAPAAPTIRAPGKPAAQPAPVISRESPPPATTATTESAPQPAASAPAAKTEPAVSAPPQTVQPAQPATPSQTAQPVAVPTQTSRPETTAVNPVQSKTQPAPVNPAKTQSTPVANQATVSDKPTVTSTPAVTNSPAVTTAPAANTSNKTGTPAAKAKTETTKPAATQKQRTAVVPGHPFRIQNKAENYNSLLSKTATRKLDAALADMIGGYGEKVPGLAVIVYKNGKEVYRNMMGNRFLSPRKKNWNLPVTSDSRFRVASISKVFTATGYMQLVEEGKINLDEDVSRYLGFTLRNPSYPNKAITSRMLLSHTSSIRDYLPYALCTV